jgi:hypothetical protein
MNRSTITVSIKALQAPEMSVEECYKRFVEKMDSIEGPFGFKYVDSSVIPKFGTSPIASMKIKYPVKGLKFVGGYSYREGKYPYFERAISDDFVWIGFGLPNKNIDYALFIEKYFPQIIEAFGGYRAAIDVNGFYTAYCGGYVPSSNGENAFDSAGNEVRDNPEFNKLSGDVSIDIDGRNNIFGLRPVQFWSRDLCNTALGYGPEEVKKKLEGYVPKVELMKDGIYLILNDNPYISFDDFLLMNLKCKKALDLI